MHYYDESDDEIPIPFQNWNYSKPAILDDELDETVPAPVPGPALQGPSQKIKKGTKKKKKVAAPRKFCKLTFEEMPLPFEDTGNPVALDDPTEYFDELSSDELLQHIAKMSNLYAMQKDTYELNTDKNEIRRLVGMFVMTAVVKMPSMELYWSTECRYAPIADVMSRQRFRVLKKYLHFADNNNENQEDKLFKVRPFLEHIRKNLQKNKKVQKNSIDEQMIPFKGRSHPKQYIRNKPHKWGFKVFTLSDSNGLMRDFKFYVGPGTCKDFGLGISGNIVLDLCESLEPNKNFQVFCDNWFSSLNLAIALREKGIFMVGTINKYWCHISPLDNKRCHRQHTGGDDDADSTPKKPRAEVSRPGTSKNTERRYPKQKFLY